MATETDLFSFADFPEDVQFCILSFLTPSEIANFTCTSKHFASLCQNDSKLWYFLCDRRWGSRTRIANWGSGEISYKLLYKTLNKWENLIGFWRRCGRNQQKEITANPSALVFFEWGPSFLSGSRVSPSQNRSYCVTKTPFLFMSVSADGQIVSFVDPDGRNMDLVPVNVDFVGKTHFSVEENLTFVHKCCSVFMHLKGEDGGDAPVSSFESGQPGSLPGISEMNQYHGNRMSPGADKAMRNRRRKEREKQGKKSWEPEHYLKIIDSSPTPDRPLQGLWKGIGEDMKLEFYFVAYDGAGMSCRRVDNVSKRLSSCAPVFWTSNPTFIKPPFSPEEESLYASRIHLQPSTAADDLRDDDVVSCIMYINSSFYLVIPGLAGTSANPWHVEGRIWQYRNGTFGFGFLRDNFIIDLRHISQNGCLLDTEEISGD